MKKAKKKAKKGDLHIRLPEELHEAVASAAEKNRRPVNSEIIVRLEASFS